MKKSISAVLAMLLLLSAVSCSDSTEKSTDETTASESAETASDVSTETETTDETDTQTHYADEIAKQDYDGWTLRIANDGLSAEYFSAFTVEELTGDAFNDSIYERNIRVAEKFNISIEEITTGSSDLIRNSVIAGSHDIGFGNVLLKSCMNLITQDYVKAISDMPVIDLSKPYWDAGSRETLTFGGKLYYGHCDISFDHYESMAVLFYNGQLLTDNNITETPYDLYKSGKWTLDKMYDMMQTVAKDANGDGKMDETNDIYGWAGREFEYLPSLYSSNTSLIKYDDTQSTYVLNLVDETVMSVGDKLNKIINDKNLALPGRNDTTRNLFKEGKVLFYSRLMGDFRNLRDKEDDYGVICYPSLAENTDGKVYVQNSYTIMIPSDCEDDERLATLVEDLAADTYDNVLNVYIDKAVIGKGTRDQQSAELLREFIQKRTYDLCYAFNISSPIEGYSAALKNNGYASAQTRYERVFAKTVTRTLESLGVGE